MTTAIITGSTGLLGKSLANHLAGKGVSVFCLGRRKLNQQELKKTFVSGVTYRDLPMRNIGQLDGCLSQEAWCPGENCIFYHFAWGGISSLADGTFADQLNNAIWSANAIKAAKKIGCKKFVNAGTLEETFITRYIAGGNLSKIGITQSNYGLSKIASRDMCKMVAYLEKIDYVHTRLSAPLDTTLNSGGYIASTLKKILNGHTYEPPINPKPFDFIPIRDASIAYELIGWKGKNKSDYFIGSGKPTTLGKLFSEFDRRTKAKSPNLTTVEDSEYLPLFSIEKLIGDIGFTPRPFLDMEVTGVDLQIKG